MFDPGVGSLDSVFILSCLLLGVMIDVGVVDFVVPGAGPIAWDCSGMAGKTGFVPELKSSFTLGLSMSMTYFNLAFCCCNCFGLGIVTLAPGVV